MTLIPHLFAGVLATAFIWLVSQSIYVDTGLQFMGPLVVIMCCHLVILALKGQLRAGFGNKLFGRSFGTAGILFISLLVAEAIVPMPAQAQSSDIGAAIGTLMFCVVIAAAILLLVGGFFWLVFKAIRAIYRACFGPGPEDPFIRFYDFGTTAAAIMVLGVLSSEGMPNGYRLDAHGTALASYEINAPREQVWAAMQTATDPSFPLPRILKGFPQPVAVVTDEGTELGTNRVVRFEGREGIGFLHSRVVNASERHAVFEVISDTSPFNAWIGFDRLIYQLEEAEGGTALTVSLDFERRLAPKIVFAPLMKGAAYLAMSVLAQDVKTRAEA